MVRLSGSEIWEIFFGVQVYIRELNGEIWSKVQVDAGYIRQQRLWMYETHKLENPAVAAALLKDLEKEAGHLNDESDDKQINIIIADRKVTG